LLSQNNLANLTNNIQTLLGNSGGAGGIAAGGPILGANAAGGQLLLGADMTGAN